MIIDIRRFKEDYFKLTNIELVTKYNIRYEKISKLRKELDLPPKKASKYYYFDKIHNKWVILKNKTFFASFETEEEAKRAVEFLKENNWNKELFQKVMKKGPKYYFFHKQSKKWRVKRRGVYFGSYETEEGAKRAVEFLKENNWNKELFLRKWGLNNPSYYYFNGYSWIVYKKLVYYGSYKTIDEAKKIVNYLKENNWDKELLLKNKNKILNGEE